MNHSVLNVTYKPVRAGMAKRPAHSGGQRALVIALGCLWGILGGLTLFFLGRLVFMQDWAQGWQGIGIMLTSTTFWRALLIGFLAQIVDGALGMAYGIIATTFLLSTGVSPALASAGVHMAKIFPGSFSRVAHVRCGNVHAPLFMRLLFPGLLGSVVGAVVVTYCNSTLLIPFTCSYLALMGLFIVGKAIGRQQLRSSPLKHVGTLALLGGFADAVGGGGWGPVVTTSLMGTRHEPRLILGSVHFTAFFLALASAASFSLLVQADIWPIVSGLVLGGMAAVPCTAWVEKYIRAWLLLLLVGTLISVLSLYNLYSALAMPL